MNEKIQNIADACGLYIAYENKAVTQKEIEFFAEQIIEECIRVCQINSSSGTGRNSSQHDIADIKARFNLA